jgi:hypothetical protein
MMAIGKQGLNRRGILRLSSFTRINWFPPAALGDNLIKITEAPTSKKQSLKTFVSMKLIWTANPRFASRLTSR